MMEFRAFHGSEFSFFCALVLSTILPGFITACTREDLAQTNIADPLRQGTPIDVARIKTGELVLDTAKLRGIRNAMASFAPGAVIRFNQPAPAPTACSDLPGSICMTLQFQGALSMDPSVVTSPPALGAWKLNVAGISLDNVFPKQTLRLIDLLRAPPQFKDFSAPFAIELSHDPAGIRVSHELGPNGVDEVGVWFPVRVALPADQFTKEFVCDCSAPGTARGRNIYPFPNSKIFKDFVTCSDICRKFPPVPRVNCDVLRLQFKVGGAHLLIGFIPELPAQRGRLAGGWTTGFSTGKNFHVRDMFDLRVVVAGTPSTFGISGTALPAEADRHDVAVAMNLDGCVLILPPETLWVQEIVEKLVAQEIAEKLGSALYETLAGKLQEVLAPLFRFDQPLPSQQYWSPTCSLLPDNTCSRTQLEAGVAASATYQLWDWLYGPFGPYPDGTWLKITGVDKTYSPAFSGAGEPAKIVFRFDADLDRDGTPNPDDNCPLTWNASQNDEDGDGTGDPCDRCPCDPSNDPDKDGVCARTCDGKDQDNCTAEPNPAQENCNLLSENEHTPGALLGDPCDPVPCPNELGAPELVPVALQPRPIEECNTVLRDVLDVRPLQSHHISQPLAAQPVRDVPTPVRFCQINPDLEIECDTSFDIQDDRADDAPCAPVFGQPDACANPEKTDTHFHRMTFTAGGNGLDPNGSPQHLDYDREAGDSSPGHVWRWDYLADWQRWVDTGLVTNAPKPEDLIGTLWLHADTPVGNTDLSLGTGFHGRQLANHHKPDFQPERLECHRNEKLRDILTPFILWKVLPDPPWDRFHRPDALPGEGDILVRAGSGQWGVIDRKGEAHIATDRIGPDVLARLRDTSLVWANSVEPMLLQGAGPSFPIAVALAADGSSVADAVTTDGRMLLADRDRAVVRQPASDGPHAPGFIPVLTRMRRGVFVVGGEHAETAAPTGEIWFAGVDADAGTPWTRLDTGGYQPAKVLAATYSFASDRLYVLDELEDRARLAEIDPTLGSAIVLSLWPRAAAWDRQWLAVDRDGAVLLASASTSRNVHAIARIDVRTDPPAVDGVDRGTGVLLLPPSVDATGYTWVLRSAEHGGITRVREPELELVPTMLTGLAEQL